MLRTENGVVPIATVDFIRELCKLRGLPTNNVRFITKWTSEKFWLGFYENEAVEGIYFQIVNKDRVMQDRIVIYYLKDLNWNTRSVDDAWAKYKPNDSVKKNYNWMKDFTHTISIFYDENNNEFGKLPAIPKAKPPFVYSSSTEVVKDVKPIKIKKAKVEEPKPITTIQKSENVVKFLSEFEGKDLPYDKLSAAQMLFVENLIPETGINAIDYAIQRVKDLRNISNKTM